MTVRDPTLRLVQRVLLAAGLFALLLGAWTARRQWHHEQRAVAARGVVVQVVEEWTNGSSGRSSTYRPVVRFRTRGGREVTFRDGLGSRPPRFSPGDPVLVWYDPAVPESAWVDAPVLATWMLPLIAGGIGAAFLLVGGVLIPRADSPHALLWRRESRRPVVRDPTTRARRKRRR